MSPLSYPAQPHQSPFLVSLTSTTCATAEDLAKPRGRRKPRDSHHNYNRGFGWGAGYAQGNKRARDEGLWNRDQPQRAEFSSWKQHEQRKRHWGQQFSRGGGWGHENRNYGKRT
eukprot:UN19915